MAYVRISIGLIVPTLIDSSLRTQPFALLSAAAFERGKRMYATLGGAAELTTQGRRVLTDMGARDFEGSDARFIVPEEQVTKALRLFEDHSSLFFDSNPAQEVFGELTQEKLEGFPPILSEKEALTVRLVFQRIAHQPIGGNTSPNERAGMKTRRLFHIFALHAPPAVTEKILRHMSVIALTDAEMLTTNGGQKKGVARNGIPLADNIGL